MTNLSEFTVEELKTLASELDGFEYDGRWGEEKLRGELDKYLLENPIDWGVPQEETVVPPVSPEEVSPEEVPPKEEKPPEELPPEANLPPVDQDDEDGDEPPVDPVAKESGGNSPDGRVDGLVAIKSDYRGEISTSLGVVNLGEDGIVAVSPEMADLLTSLKGYERC